MLLLVGFWASVFWPVLSGAVVHYYGDLALYFIPQFDFQAAVLRSGRIPLWNPYVLAGVPFVGNPQASPLYPTGWILSGFAAEHAVGAVGALHCLWAALGMWLGLRRFGLDAPGAWLGALVYGFGGALVSKVQFPNMVAAGAWLPWMLWALDTVLVRPDARSAALWAVVLALSILAAHPQITFFGLLVCLTWALRQRPRRPALCWLATGTVVGGMVAGSWLVPVVETTLGSVRPQLGLAQANRFVLPPEGLGVLWVAPWFFGTPWGEPGWVLSGNVWESCVFVGWIPVVLAVAGVWSGRRSSVVRWWLGVFVVAVWLSLGRAGGLYSIAYTVVPGLSKFHDPARFLLVSQWALAFLAGYGLDRLRLRSSVLRGISAWGLAFGAMVPLGLFAAGFYPTMDHSEFARARGVLAGAIPDDGLLWHQGVLAGWRRSIDRRGFQPLLSEGAAFRFVASGLPNLPMLVGRRMADGYEPVRPAATDLRRGALMSERGRDVSGWEARLVKRYGIGVAGALRGTGLETIWRVTGAGTGNRDGIAKPDGRQPVVVKRDERRVVMDLTDVAGEWVSTETASPGWRLFVDGVGSRWQVDPPTGYRRFRTPSGSRSGEWIYDPMGWRLGLFLSCVGGCILAVLLVGNPVRQPQLSRHVQSDHHRSRGIWNSRGCRCR